MAYKHHMWEVAQVKTHTRTHTHTHVYIYTHTNAELPTVYYSVMKSDLKCNNSRILSAMHVL